MSPRTALPLALLLAACEPEPSDGAPGADSGAPGVPEAEAAPLVVLEGPALLRRLSLDLRGELPSLAELEAVEADPDQIWLYRDAWLEEEAFEERLVWLLGERWATLVDSLPAEYYEYGYSFEERHAWNRSVGQEPLRLLARVATSDRPWTDIVTTDTTMANEMLAESWPMEGYPEGGSGWHEVRYADGRPAAGVLVSNGLWWRYQTSSFNQNRSRADALTRLVVCRDMLERPVSFEARDDLIQETETVDQIRSDPGCLSCHAVVEPLSAVLFGFWTVADHGGVEAERYHPEREPLGAEVLGVQPAWFGTPVSGLEELGQVIAEDPRLRDCAAETFAELVLRRELGLEDHDLQAHLVETLEEADLRVLPMIRALTERPEYRAAPHEDNAEAAEITRRSLSPDLLDTVHFGLTGFRWSQNGIAMLDDPNVGYRVIAGGIDGVDVTQLQPSPTVGSTLVARRLAEASADHAATAAWGGDAPTGPMAELPLEPTEEELRAALAEVHFRLLARRPSEEELDELAALWQAVLVMDELPLTRTAPQHAWTAVWTALTRDLEFLTY